MFSGIIESVATIEAISVEGSNTKLTVSCAFIDEVYIDQSIAHNGVCLTVTEIHDKSYSVIAIQETLDKTNLGRLNVGNPVNIERCLKISSRLDGHIVQGHVDTTAVCNSVQDFDGSWVFSFEFNDTKHQGLIVPKGSITINGVSLTVVTREENGFSVAIIPYTFEHTVFKYLNSGDPVNIEFDILGKYVQENLSWMKA